MKNFFVFLKNFFKKNGKRLLIFVLCTTMLIGVLGFLTSGFRSSNINTSSNTFVNFPLEGVIECEGWSLHYKDGNDKTAGYDGVRAVFAVNTDAVKAYEDAGYEVMYGVVYGLGKAADGGVVNTKTSLSVKIDEDWSVTTDSAHAIIKVGYATNEDIEQGSNLVPAESIRPGVVDRVQWMVASTMLEDGEDCNDNTYVAAAFIAVKNSSGDIEIVYTRAKELLHVDPMIAG